MENSDQAVPAKVGLLLRKPFFFWSEAFYQHFLLALIIAALLLSWLFSLQAPGSRAGVPACKGLSLPKPISSLGQGFGWAAITPKSLYFWCCFVPLKPLRVCPSSPQKPHQCLRDPVGGRSIGRDQKKACLELIFAPVPEAQPGPSDDHLTPLTKHHPSLTSAFLGVFSSYSPACFGHSREKKRQMCKCGVNS